VLAADAAAGDPQPPIECYDCGHRYAPYRVTHAPDGTELEVPYFAYPLDTAVIDAGRDKIRRMVRSIIANNYELERLKDGRI
jgi:hypothetical protein